MPSDSPKAYDEVAGTKLDGRVFSRDTLALILAAADEDGDGMLSVDEVVGNVDVDDREPEEAMRKAFGMADADGDGMITDADEMDNLLKQLDEALRQMEETMRKWTEDLKAEQEEELQLPEPEVYPLSWHSVSFRCACCL